MKGPFIIHGTWCAIAIASFYVGYQWFPARLGQASQAASNPALARDAEDGLLGKAKRSATSDTNSLKLGSIAALKESQIKALGETFRDSASPIERRLAFSKLLEGLTAENALLIREQIAHMDHRSAEFREFHYAWGAVGGVDATMFGATTPEDDMAPALAGWANASPDAALAWFDGLHIDKNPDFEYLLKDRKIDPQGLRHHIMRGLVQGLANHDPMTASKFVVGMAEGGDKAAPRMMHTIADAVMRTDKPSTAIAWAETLPKGAARTVAMNRIADRFVDEDSQAAAAWATQYAEQPEGRGVIGEVGANWSHRDPQAALEWLTDLPHSHGQNNGLHRAMHDWTSRDPTAASEYLTDMPDSPAKNAAITGLSSRLAWEDPQAAIAWATTITSEGQRHKTMATVGQAWARKDAQAATDWAAAAGLPQEVQQAIANPPRDKRRR